MSAEHCAYRYRLEPDQNQRNRLEQMANARRFAYNWGLARWRDYYAVHRETIPFKQLFRELTSLKRKPGYRWLSESDSQSLQQALFDLRQAYRNFFERRARYPRFKARKRDFQRFRIPQRVRLQGSRVYVPKIGWIKARVSRPLTGDIKGATFRRDATGKWFVSIVTEFEIPPPSNGPRRLPRIVGVDLGVQEFAVCSDGVRVPAPRFTRQSRRKLRRAHRTLSRKQRGSRNRARARRDLARVYQRAGNRRLDFLHKLTTELTRSHDVLAIEDLGVTGLARTKLAGAIMDSGFHEFRRQLTYKARWQGKKLVVVERFLPSSKRCSNCGAVNSQLTPRMRRWTCPCGADHDRDLNAAQNLQTEAMKEMVAVGRTDTKKTTVELA